MPGGDGTGPPWWRGRFRGCGFRMTLPREMIFSILVKTDKHLSAEDIYHEMHKQYPAIGLTTIYRTLDLLVHMGLVHKFDFGDGRARFELAERQDGEKDHHHHLVCVRCGVVVNYTEFLEDELNLIKKTQSGLEKKYNFEIFNHMVQFTGVCARCREKK